MVRFAAGLRADFSTVAEAAARLGAAADTSFRRRPDEVLEEGVSEFSRGVLEDTNNLS
jgi:hypothetical protein